MTTAFDSARFRQVLGHYPTGVTVVTAAPEGAPYGLAIGSFASVSLDPPLVVFVPDKSSSTFPKVQEAGVFCVNVLGDDQEEICRVFASKGTDKFATVGWKPAPKTGSPIINDVLAWIDCEVERIDDGGDHWLVLGRVVDLGVRDGDGGPLLFYRGGYGRYAV